MARAWRKVAPSVRTNALQLRACSNSSTDLLLTTRPSNGVLVLTLNQPGKRNALSSDMMTALQDALCEASMNQGDRVVIINSKGPVFSAGHDLKEVAGMDTKQHDMLFRQCSNLMAYVTEMPKVVIASVQGLATAAGCQLVAACDLAVASEGSSFATPGVHIGLFCSTPAVAIGRAIGRKNAMRMLVTGEVVPAELAMQWGLINQVVQDKDEDQALRQEALPTSRLYGETMALANVIASRPSATIAHGKGVFYQQIEAPLGEAYEMASVAMVEGMQKDDAKEGVSAFLQKRAPVWPSNL